MGTLVISGINRASTATLMIDFGISIALVIGSYYFWTFTIRELLQWIMSESSSYQKLLNLVGFAYAPQIFAVFTLIPLLGRPIELSLNAWSLFAVTIALQHKLNIKLIKAFRVCFPGWILSNIGIGIIQILEQR
jgi:hypothetical protein